MGGGNGSNVLLWFFGLLLFKTKINFIFLQKIKEGVYLKIEFLLYIL